MKQAPQIGVLCYDLSVASSSVLAVLADELPEYRVKAYPLFGPPPRDPTAYSYRPANREGRGVSFSRPGGEAPEVMLRTVGLPVVLDLVRESHIIVLLGLQALPALLACLGARIVDKPVLVVNQAMGPVAELQRSLAIRAPKWLLLRLATAYIAQTSITVETLQHVYKVDPRRIVLAQWDGGAADFAEVARGAEQEDRLTLRQKWDIASDSYVLTFVGTLIYLKGVDLAIQAFARLTATSANALLLIVGPEGAEAGRRRELESLCDELAVHNSVQFLGARPREELAEIYGCSDVFVLPTRKDIWPKVLVEAGWSRLPLVTTNICGAAGYLVQHGVNGFVTAPNDIEAIYRAFVDLADPALRSRMGQKSREIVEGYMQTEGNRGAYKAAIELTERLTATSRRRFLSWRRTD